MTAQVFVNVLSIGIAFIASLYFCIGSAELKKSNIKTLSGTYYGGNNSLRNFFVSLKADYLCGAFCLCIAFLLQFFSNVPGEVPAKVLFQDPKAGAGYAALASFGVGLCFWFYRKWVIKKMNEQLALDKG